MRMDVTGIREGEYVPVQEDFSISRDTYPRGNMPLIKSASDKAAHENIREMIYSGHPQAQAVAAALRNQDEQKKKEGSK